ncbi:nucleoside hydrolase [Enterocloster lavalensis]|uniref:nucleoside hydrolase n=1 Tax=Enterocloster lavalensis TaxID=460384 RepID=UPI001D062FE5|nr:nucleoside hydrolase [Enterocloster lavalensis]MCB6346651.1 nucleoside hydrolase [Enterocloster lavalensis]
MMERIIIDTDPGVDDAMAILLAVKAADRLKIEALTTVDGNVGIRQVTDNALSVLELCGADHIPVYRGADRPLGKDVAYSDDFHGSDGLGGVNIRPERLKTMEEPAVDYLVRAAAEHPGELTLVLLGPMTNAALAVRKDPGFAQNIRRLVVMGGAEHGGNMSPVAEFNFFHDPQAASEVFQAGFKEIVMVGLDATGKVYMTPAMRELLYLIGTPISRFIHKITRRYTDRRWEINRVMGCQLCDPLVAGYLIDPGILTLEDAHVEIEIKGRCEGMSVVYRTKRYPELQANCKIAVDTDSRRFFDVFYLTQFPEYRTEINAMLDREFR